MSKKHKSVRWFERSRTLMKRAAELGYQLDVDGEYITIENYVTKPHFRTLAGAEAFVNGAAHVYENEVGEERGQGDPPIDAFEDHAKLRKARRGVPADRLNGVAVAIRDELARAEGGLTQMVEEVTAPAGSDDSAADAG